MKTFDLDDWQKGPIKHEHLQQPVTAIRALLLANGLEGPDAEADARNRGGFLGIVKASGGGGEADYTDERYWVERAIIKGGARAARITVGLDTLEAFDTGTRPEGYIHTASNIAEKVSGTHNVPVNTPVWVHAVMDGGATPQKRFVFNTSAMTPAGVLFEVTVAQSGGTNGNLTTAPTYTYNVTNLAGTSIGSALAVLWARPKKGAVTAATHGFAFYDASGTLVLALVDEVYNTSTTDVVTAVTCNGDGTITVTTATIQTQSAT